MGNGTTAANFKLLKIDGLAQVQAAHFVGRETRRGKVDAQTMPVFGRVRFQR